MTPIVPLCMFTMRCFPVRALLQLLTDDDSADSAGIALHRITAGSADDIADNKSTFDSMFVPWYNSRQQHTFTCGVYAPEANLRELVKTENVFIFMVASRTFAEIKQVLFFRKSCVQLAAEQEVLSCFASVCADDHSPAAVQWFVRAVAALKTFAFCAIDAVSHNTDIVDALCARPHLQTESISCPVGYFFYNFSCPTVPARQLIVVG